MLSSTLLNNMALGDGAEGGGVYVTDGAIVDLRNSLLWANTATTADDIYTDEPSLVTVSHCIARNEPL